jgi:hypothetical protein
MSLPDWHNRQDGVTAFCVAESGGEFDPVGWYWAEAKGNGRPRGYGPFPTREAAIQSGHDNPPKGVRE